MFSSLFGYFLEEMVVVKEVNLILASFRCKTREIAGNKNVTKVQYSSDYSNYSVHNFSKLNKTIYGVFPMPTANKDKSLKK